MAALLAPALCAISELVRHALWSGGAPLRGNPGYGVFLLLTIEGGPALAGSPFRLSIPHQSSMIILLPEVHAPSDP